jgi:hypothetical protein
MSAVQPCTVSEFFLAPSLLGPDLRDPLANDALNILQPPQE